MTFQSSYAKLLADPTFGQINHRERHAREMYLAGMKYAYEIVCREVALDATVVAVGLKIIEAIAEESK